MSKPAIAALALGALALGATLSLPSTARAQGGDSTTSSTPHYGRTLVLGATTSIALHELAHITTALALGAHPTFGFNDFRPTIYSGINSRIAPHKQFLFSSAGLDVQNLLDEAILDIAHSRGSAFERGVLGGGIGTTLFYLTIGRTGSVSDIEYIARTHAMTKTQATLLYGAIAGSHIWRMSRNPHYANFFVRARGGAAELGLSRAW